MVSIVTTNAERLIRESGYKHYHIAKMLGYDCSTFSLKFNGHRNYTIKDIFGLSQLLNVPVESFFKAL